MNNLTEVFLFGSLNGESSGTHALPIHCDLGQPIPLPDLLDRLQIPPGRVQLTMVNHRAVPPDHLILPGDRVALFPREYAIFADWRDLRSNAVMGPRYGREKRGWNEGGQAAIGNGPGTPESLNSRKE